MKIISKKISNVIGTIYAVWKNEKQFFNLQIIFLK